MLFFVTDTYRKEKEEWEEVFSGWMGGSRRRCLLQYNCTVSLCMQQYTIAHYSSSLHHSEQ